jgi:hypothetical protein
VLGASSSGRFSSIGGGRSNAINVEVGTIPGGQENVVTASYGLASGYRAKARFYGAVSQASGYFSSAGDAQATQVTLRAATTTASPVALTLDVSSSALVIPGGVACTFSALVVARNTNTASGEGAGYKVEGVVIRGSTAASTAFIGSPTVTILGEVVVGWDISVSVDTSAGSLVFTATGEASKTIHWLAAVRLAEVS